MGPFVIDMYTYIYIYVSTYEASNLGNSQMYL